MDGIILASAALIILAIEIYDRLIKYLLTALLIVVNSLEFQLMRQNLFQVLSDFAHSRNAVS